MKEIWKDIKGFEGCYQVSNLGRVKSLERKVTDVKKTQIIKEKIKNQSDNGNGYMTVHLYMNGKRTIKYVHRLVAEAFIGIHNHKEINHKDFDRKNNILDNLEYCNRIDNIRYSLNANRYDESKLVQDIRQYGKKSNMLKEIIKLNNNGITKEEICRRYKISYNTLKKYGIELKNYGTKGMSFNNKKILCINTDEIFNSISEANKKYNITTIGDCCSGRQKTAGGLYWRYYEQ